MVWQLECRGILTFGIVEPGSHTSTWVDPFDTFIHNPFEDTIGNEDEDNSYPRTSGF